MLIEREKHFDYKGQMINYWNKVLENPNLKNMIMYTDQDRKHVLKYTLEYPDK